MGILRSAAGMIFSGRSFSQKTNYMKYLFSVKREKLNYDPVTISIVATTRCTLACDMCPTHSSKVPRSYPHTQKDAGDMEFGVFKDMIDRFANAATVHMIGSGEPLLNKDFFRMVDYAAGKRMAVKTFSNGTTVKENIEKILNSKLDGITISLNGHDAKEFSRMTGAPGHLYDQIYGGIEELVRRKKAAAPGLKVKLSFIIDRQNYKSIPRMIDVSLRLGVDHAFFCNFLSCPYDGLTARERSLTADDPVKEELRDIFEKYPRHVRKMLTPPVPIDSGIRDNKCRTHFSQIRLDALGNVSSCSMMLLDMTGHGHYTHKDVWNNDFFKGMRKVFLSCADGRLPEPCRVCPDNKGLA